MSFLAVNKMFLNIRAFFICETSEIQDIRDSYFINSWENNRKALGCYVFINLFCKTYDRALC